MFAKITTRINLNDGRSIEFWKNLLNVTVRQLRIIVKKAGSSPVNVMNYIGDKLDERSTDEFFYYHNHHHPL